MHAFAVLPNDDLVAAGSFALLLLLILPWLQNGRTWQVPALDWLLASVALG